MLIDLHVHTQLSADSNVAAENYLRAAAAKVPALDAICFTEHRLYPADAAIGDTYAELEQQFGILIFKGIEADTNLGHLLIFGVNDEIRRRFDLTGRMHRAERLIELVHAEGGVAIPAHPFRDSGYGSRLDALLAKVGSALHSVEAINGQNSEEQNQEAFAACEKLGLNPVAGSDAHFATPQWFLTCATEFEAKVKTVAELCAELRAGRARPFRFPSGAGSPPAIQESR
jgi:predicted metal-dependent phosphoesterase TrpH